MAKKEISRPQTAGIPPFGLRLQPDLKKRVEEAAIASGRSMNAEIVTRLESTFTSGKLALGLVAFGGDGPDVMAVGKTLETLPVDLSTLYGLRLYREELKLVIEQMDEARIASADKGSFSTLVLNLEKEAIHLSRTIFAIHTYRKLQGLKNLRDEEGFPLSIESKFADSVNLKS